MHTADVVESDAGLTPKGPSGSLSRHSIAVCLHQSQVSDRRPPTRDSTSFLTYSGFLPLERCAIRCTYANQLKP